MYGTGPTAVYTGPYNLRYSLSQVLLRVLARSSLASDATCGTRDRQMCGCCGTNCPSSLPCTARRKCCSLTTWPITKSEQCGGCGLSASNINQRSRHADFFPTKATSYQYFITRVGHKTQQSTQSMHQPSFDVAHGNTAYL